MANKRISELPLKVTPGSSDEIPIVDTQFGSGGYLSKKTTVAGLLASVTASIESWWAGSASKTKLDGIQAGATANATDAQLRDRTTHTGTQAISTITDLQTALDGKAAASHTQAISTVTGLQTALDGKAASSHAHGNITSDGKIGSTSGLPILTTTSGALTAGSFGSTAGTVCEGNDSRLGSNVRSLTAGISGAAVVTNCVALSQANYDAIAVKDPNTLYVIT